MYLVQKQDFVHLHAHSEYSYLDSIIPIRGLGKHLRKRGFSSYAMTEHGNINGIFQFHKELKKHNVKPILGCEFYIVEDRHSRGLTDEQKQNAAKLGKEKGLTAREAKKEEEKRLGIRSRYHVVCLAKNNLGWRKIIRAVELSHKEGFYYFPRIDFEILEKLAPDVIVMTACLGGVPGQLINKGDFGKAQIWASRFVEIFHNDFYIEIQPNDIELQVEMNLRLIELASCVDCDIVATNDVHYLNAKDYETHDVLLAVRESQGGKPVLVSDTKRFRYSTNQLYLKSRKEMEESFRRFHPNIHDSIWQYSLDTTLEIAGKIDDNVLEFRKGVLPKLKIEEEYERDPDKKLVALVKDGWKWRKVEEKTENKFGYIDWVAGEDDEKKPLIEVCKARVDYELGEILRLGFSRYFLVIYDLVWWARRNGIRVGPGRGSVGGSYVAYLLGITAVDSVRHGCPFSRFISPDRIDYPDIDLDFPSTERDRVKKYLVSKYGKDKVAGIVNYDRMKGKQILKDIGRVYGVPWQETEKVTKLVPKREDGDENVYDCVVDTFEENPEVAWYKKQYPNVVRHASILEGNVRHLGVHAAGMVVTDKPIRTIVPVQYQRKDGNAGEYLAGWDKKEVEKCGLLKLDILGTKGLTSFQRCLDLIKQRTGEDIEPEDIEEYNDTKVWAAFQKGFTELVWQMSSFGTVNVLKRLKPTKLAHLVATNALIRPGPQNSGITDKYIKRKNGLESKILHEKLEEILEQTYGLFVFQEDVIRIVHSVGGFTLAEADRVRKDIGKKKGVDYLKKTYLDRFVASAEDHGINEKTAIKIWNMIAEFGKYGFNKAHSTGYSILSYWTMYFKIHYPLEYMCAALESEKEDDKRRRYIKEARRLEISVTCPDVNVSGMNFTIDNNLKSTVRAGLVDVKGIGEKTVVKIVAGSPYKDFKDFVVRSGANKTATSALLKIGALDTIVDNPKQLDESLTGFMKAKQGSKNTFEKRWAKVELKEVERKYTHGEKEKHKLSLLSLPPETHPALKAVDWLSSNCSHITWNRIADFEKLFPGHFSSENFAFVGVVAKAKYYQDDKAPAGFCETRLARIILEDDSGQADCHIPARVLGTVGADNTGVGKTLGIIGSAVGYFKISVNAICSLDFLMGGISDSTVLGELVSDDCFEDFVDFLDGREKLKSFSIGRRSFKTCVHIIDKLVWKTKTGKTMMKLLCSDWLGHFREVLVWPSDFTKLVNKIEVDEPYVVDLSMKKDGGKVTYFVDGNTGRSPVVGLDRYYRKAV
jgi:DNA polymerase-3 subunit alpha